MEITSQNFEQSLSLVEQSLRNAEFISIDLEMTGIALGSTYQGATLMNNNMNNSQNLNSHSNQTGLSLTRGTSMEDSQSQSQTSQQANRGSGGGSGLTPATAVSQSQMNITNQNSNQSNQNNQQQNQNKVTQTDLNLISGGPGISGPGPPGGGNSGGTTGTNPSDSGEQIGDTPHARYLKSKKIAETFGIIQIGICTFDGHGTARPFNFYVFPRPVKEPPYATFSRRFQIDADAIHFNRRHSCDFGRWLTHGISYVDKATEQNLFRSLREFENFGDSRALLMDPSQNNKESQKRLEEHLDEIEGLLFGKDGSTPQEYVCLGLYKPQVSYVRALVGHLKTDVRFRRKVLIEKWHSPSLEGCREPELYVRKLRGLQNQQQNQQSNQQQNQNQGQQSQKVPIPYQESYEAAEKQRGRDLRQRHERSLGFRRVWKMLKRLSVPIALHNGLMDLMFLYCQLEERTLPDTLPEFQQLMSEQLFPESQIFDTKWLAGHLSTGKTVLGGKSWLGHLYQNLPFRSLPVGTESEQFSRYFSSRTDKTQSQQAQQQQALSNEISDFNDQYNHFESSTDDTQAPAFAHEAAFDSYMTGSVFWFFKKMFQVHATRFPDIIQSFTRQRHPVPPHSDKLLNKMIQQDSNNSNTNSNTPPSLIYDCVYRPHQIATANSININISNNFSPTSCQESASEGIRRTQAWRSATKEVLLQTHGSNSNTTNLNSNNNNMKSKRSSTPGAGTGISMNPSPMRMSGSNINNSSNSVIVQQSQDPGPPTTSSNQQNFNQNLSTLPITAKPEPLNSQIQQGIQGLQQLQIQQQVQLQQQQQVQAMHNQIVQSQQQQQNQIQNLQGPGPQVPQQIQTYNAITGLPVPQNNVNLLGGLNQQNQQQQMYNHQNQQAMNLNQQQQIQNQIQNMNRMQQKNLQPGIGVPQNQIQNFQFQNQGPMTVGPMGTVPPQAFLGQGPPLGHPHHPQQQQQQQQIQVNQQYLQQVVNTAQQIQQQQQKAIVPSLPPPIVPLGLIEDSSSKGNQSPKNQRKGKQQLQNHNQQSQNKVVNHNQQNNFNNNQQNHNQQQQGQNQQLQQQNNYHNQNHSSHSHSNSQWNIMNNSFNSNHRGQSQTSQWQYFEGQHKTEAPQTLTDSDEDGIATVSELLNGPHQYNCWKEGQHWAPRPYNKKSNYSDNSNSQSQNQNQIRLRYVEKGKTVTESNSSSSNATVTVEKGTTASTMATANSTNTSATVTNQQSSTQSQSHGKQQQQQSQASQTGQGPILRMSASQSKLEKYKDNNDELPSSDLLVPDANNELTLLQQQTSDNLNQTSYSDQIQDLGFGDDPSIANGNIDDDIDDDDDDDEIQTLWDSKVVNPALLYAATTLEGIRSSNSAGSAGVTVSTNINNNSNSNVTGVAGPVGGGSMTMQTEIMNQQGQQNSNQSQSQNMNQSQLQVQQNQANSNAIVLSQQQQQLQSTTSQNDNIIMTQNITSNDQQIFEDNDSRPHFYDWFLAYSEYLNDCFEQQQDTQTQNPNRQQWRNTVKQLAQETYSSFSQDLEMFLMGADRLHLVNNNFDLPLKTNMLSTYSGKHITSNEYCYVLVDSYSKKNELQRTILQENNNNNNNNKILNNNNNTQTLSVTVKWMETDILPCLVVTSDVDLYKTLQQHCQWLYDCSKGEISRELEQFWRQEALNWDAEYWD